MPSPVASLIRRVPELAVAARVTDQWPALARAYARAGSLRYPFEFRSRAGDRVMLHEHGDLTTLWRVWFGREYDIPADARAIVDLGANIGILAVLAARTAPQSRIFCVEAFPETHERLGANIALNGLGDRVRAACCAAGGEAGTVRFDARATVPGNQRHIADLNAWKNIADTIDVPVRTFDDLMDEAGFDAVDFLKIDIEGAEYDLLDRAGDDRLRRCRAIGLEWHANRPWQDLWKRLESAGFRCLRRTPPGATGQAMFARA